MCHAVSRSEHDYWDNVQRTAFNFASNAALDHRAVVSADAALTEGSLLRQIEAERMARKERFERMLQEKYDALDDATFRSVVRCRRCGSEDVRWEDKQTRSADEGASVFVSCNTCRNRWVIR